METIEKNNWNRKMVLKKKNLINNLEQDCQR